VKTGIIGETDIEISQGLQEGDEIVVGSYKTLRTLKDQAKIKLDVKRGGKGAGSPPRWWRRRPPPPAASRSSAPRTSGART